MMEEDLTHQERGSIDIRVHQSEEPLIDCPISGTPAALSRLKGRSFLNTKKIRHDTSTE
jgi:hypothetical protein